MTWIPWVASNIVLASVLGAAALVVHRWLRRPAVAHVLWVLVIVKLVTPPLLHVPVTESPGLTACDLGTCGCDHHSPTQSFVTILLWSLPAVWAAGSGITGWTAWRCWTRFQRLTAHARPAPPAWQEQAERLAFELSIRYPPEILIVSGRLPPLVVPGRYRPRLLLPGDLTDRLSAEQRDALLLHELTHLKRGDHRVRWLELTVRIIYWWLPMVGMFCRQLRDCEEECCDAAVVARRPDGRREYAGLLLDVVDFTRPIRIAADHVTAMSAASSLERRLRKILRDAGESRRPWPAVVLAAGLACAVLPCGLHFDLVSRPTPSSLVPSGAAETCSPGGNREVELVKVMCCPS